MGFLLRNPPRYPDISRALGHGARLHTMERETMTTKQATFEVRVTFTEATVQFLREHYGKLILAGFGATFAFMLYKLALIIPTL